MHVFAVLGPSGCGKTSAINVLKSSYEVTTMSLDYLDSYPIQFSNRELLSKWSWIAHWFECIWKFKSHGTKLLVTDRCPLDIVPYADDGISLIDALNITINELQKHDVWIQTIYVQTPFNICFDRTQKRLLDETTRKNYGEADFEYSKLVHSFYEKGFKKQWDFTIRTEGMKIEDVADNINEIVRSDLNEF